MADSPDDSAIGGDASQRRSGRVVRAPTKFQQEIATPPKRKHTGEDGGAVDDLENGDADDLDAEEDDDDGSGDDGDDGEANSRSRPKRKANGSSAARRAVKKPKLNGASGNHAASLPSRPKKSVRMTIETDGDHDSALYGEFRRGIQLGRLSVLTVCFQPTSSHPVTIATTWLAAGTSGIRRTTRPPLQTSSTAFCLLPAATTT